MERLDGSIDGSQLKSSNEPETYNHWSIVNLVFHHLAAQGLHPVLGGSSNPGVAAADLLLALGIQPVPEGNRQVADEVKQRLAELRTAAFESEAGYHGDAASGPYGDRVRSETATPVSR